MTLEVPSFEALFPFANLFALEVMIDPLPRSIKCAFEFRTFA